MPPLQRSSGSSEPVRMLASKTVTFRPTVRVAWTIGLQDYSEEEKQASFYSSSEHAEIVQRTRSEVKLIVAGGLPTTPNDFEIHGLQGFFPPAAARKHIRRALAWDEVLLEQSRQYKDGIHDADVIADLYRIATHDSIVEARDYALSSHAVDEDDDTTAATNTTPSGARTSSYRLYYASHHEHRLRSPRTPIPKRRKQHRQTTSQAA